MKPAKLAKLRPCAYCKNLFAPTRPLQQACKPLCALRLVRAKKAKERVETRKRREAIKTIPTLIKEAQIVFNSYVRERDKDQPCICCGKPLGDGATGGDFDAGHYRSTGSASHLRFDERNAHAQRKFCNRYLAGNAVSYRVGLIARIGLPAVEALESDNTPRKWTRDELIELRATYKRKLKELQEKE